jgi:hypothetical protein
MRSGTRKPITLGQIPGNLVIRGFGVEWVTDSVVGIKVPPFTIIDGKDWQQVSQPDAVIQPTGAVPNAGDDRGKVNRNCIGAAGLNRPRQINSQYGLIYRKPGRLTISSGFEMLAWRCWTVYYIAISIHQKSTNWQAQRRYVPLTGI